MRSTTLAVAALLAPAFCSTLPAQCQVTVTRTDTTMGNLLCPWMRYCYEVCVPNGCTPVIKICVDFPTTVPVSGLTVSSAPVGWTATTVGNRICWTMSPPGVPILGGGCATFCVDTGCWPDEIPGVQTWQANDDGQPNHNGQTRSPVGAKAVLAANGPGNLGAQRRVHARDLRNQGGLGLVYFSLNTAQLTLPGLGELLIDPSQAFWFRNLPIDGNGLGQTLLAVPQDPYLVGYVLYFQSLMLPDVHLSTRLDFPLL